MQDQLVVKRFGDCLVLKRKWNGDDDWDALIVADDDNSDERFRLRWRDGRETPLTS